MFTDTLPPDCNGVATSVMTLAMDLAKAGHQVTILSPCKINSQADYRAEVEFMAIPGISPRCLSFSVAVPAIYWRSRLKAIRLARFDIFHAHGPGPMCLYAVALSRCLEIPLVSTLHTDLVAYSNYYRTLSMVLHPVLLLLFWLLRRHGIFQTSRNIPPLQGLIRGVAEASQLVVFPSSKVAVAYLKLGLVPRHKALVCASGLDYPEYDLLQLRRPKLIYGSYDSTRLLYVGRLAAEKNIALLLDAFEILLGRGTKVELVLVGPIQCRKLRRRLRNMVADILFTPGEVRDLDLWGQYSRADIFVFPSLSDTQGLVLLEAAHAGLPVITVDPTLSADPSVDSTEQARLGVFSSSPDPYNLAWTIESVLPLLRDESWVLKVREAGREIAKRNSAARYALQMNEAYSRVRAATSIVRRIDQ